MKFSSIIISLLVLILVATTILNFFSGVTEEYPVEIDSNTAVLLGNYTTGLDEIEANARELNETVFDVNPSFTDLLGGFLAGGYSALKTAGNSLSTLDGMVENTSKALDVPSYWWSVARLIILVIAVFLVIGVLVGRDI